MQTPLNSWSGSIPRVLGFISRRPIGSMRVVLPLSLIILAALASPLSAQPRSNDAQSRCLPTGPPPVGGYEAYLGPVHTRSERVIGGVPGYEWYRGCGPTAAGMLIGYYDGNGFSWLIPGDASAQTDDVEDAIASPGHWTDYSLPLDDEGTGLLQDNSYYGGAHAGNSLGDFMRTSWYTANNYYGWSWQSDIENALEDYTTFINTTYGTAYAASSHDESWGSFTWNKLLAEIDADRPLILLVDTDGDGTTDHFVTCIGYRDTAGFQEYACLDTWAPPGNIRWERFRGISAGSTWGIAYATYFTITGSDDCNDNGIPDACDIDCGSPGDPCYFIGCGLSDDCNNNGVPDDCLAFEIDCNANKIPDACDIAQETSADCNENGVPDECEPDTCPPTNLTWAEEPHPISSTEIRMVGYAEDVTLPIEYAIDGLVGGHDRDWDTNPVYIDSGLAKNMYHQYTLAARDSSPLQNATGQGLLRTVGTAIETPSELTFGTITQASIEVFTAHDEDVGGVFTNLTFYDSGLFFEVTTPGGVPVGGGDANTWVQEVSQGIVATGLTSGSTYRFRVKARNLFATETNWYPLDDPSPEYIEQATVMPPCQHFSGDLNGDSEINGMDIRCMVECMLDGDRVGCDCACGDMFPPPIGGDGLDLNDVTAFVDAVLD